MIKIFLCLVFVACSFVFATQNIPIIVSLMSFSWGIVSGCFIGPYIWGLFSKRITKIGAYSGILSGLLVVGISTLVISLNSGFGTAAEIEFYTKKTTVDASSESLLAASSHMLKAKN